jgi:sterol desaturase/sphingolipid hydroxylase (fatty acid hydroxylase superfamily)
MRFLQSFSITAGSYAFWLLILSAFCFALERFFPWRKEQRAFRKGFVQDLFWLAFNGHIFGVLLWQLGAWLWPRLGVSGVFDRIEAVRLLQAAPLAVQFLVLLVLKDFVEWWIHRMLHRVPALWEFHKVHHSIEELDWIGNFRFHWMETVIYRSLTYLPLAVLGIDARVALWVAVFATLIGHLNHSNLPISWGPLRYVLNSPKMHVWHHDFIVRGGYGRNFGIVFSVWDWAFGTAEMPEGQPARLGFDRMEAFPRRVLERLVHPLASPAYWRHA